MRTSSALVTGGGLLFGRGMQYNRRNMVEVKICGLTRLNDLRVAERAGADYLGMIVEIGRSPRCLTRATARLLARGATGRIVPVIADEPVGRAVAIATATGAAALQLHGSETPEYVAALRDALPAEIALWRALSLPREAPETQREAVVAELLGQIEALAGVGVARIVLDSRVQGVSGGAGVTCDWSVAAQVVAGSALPVMLAGGIAPGNVREALVAVRPIGVDISSGVERKPGVKDPAAVLSVIARARVALPTDET